MRLQLGPFWGHFRPSRGHLGPSRGSWGHLGPSRGHPGSILRHFSVTTSEDGRCIADFVKCARRRHETAILSILGSSWDHLGAILGPFWAISGILGPSWAISGPSRGHPTSILRHFRLTTSEDGRCIADFAKFAPRLHETSIMGCLVPTCGLSSPSWRRLLAVLRPSPGRLGAILGPSWLILGPLGATLGRLGPSRGEDRRRHSRFSKICTSLTREHHFGLVVRL